MNDKLRQFERASGLEIYGLGAKRIPWEAALEKYAQLIVYDMLGELTNDDTLGPARIETISRLATRYGVAR